MLSRPRICLAADIAENPFGNRTLTRLGAEHGTGNSGRSKRGIVILRQLGGADRRRDLRVSCDRTGGRSR
jgi:hypothetical protein